MSKLDPKTGFRKAVFLYYPICVPESEKCFDTMHVTVIDQGTDTTSLSTFAVHFFNALATKQYPLSQYVVNSQAAGTAFHSTSLTLRLSIDHWHRMKMRNK